MEIKALLKKVNWLLGGAIIALVALFAMGMSLMAKNRFGILYPLR
jgi:hypothetical protein